MTAPNPNYDNLLTTTLVKVIPTLTDNIFGALPLTYWLQRKQQVKSLSGVKVRENLEYAANGSFGFYSGYDTLTLTQNEFMTAAEFPWAQFSVAVGISGIEEAENSGSEQVVNLLESKINNAQRTIQSNLNLAFYKGKLTNLTTPVKDINGLGALIGDATDGVVASSGTVVGNIDAASVAWWRSPIDRPGSDTVLSLTDLSKQYHAASVGNDTPDFEITTQTLWEKYEALLQPSQRFTDPKTAEAGFETLMHKGAVVMWDTDMAVSMAKDWLFLNSKYLHLRTHPSTWLKNGPFIKRQDQDAKYSVVLSYGQLTVNNRRMHGALTKRIPA